MLGPWRTVPPINTPTWVMERNPFYYAVDTEGNQLPYSTAVLMTLAENLEVLNLRAIAGEYDLQERHTDIAKLPVILENQEQGDYSVHLDPAFNGSDATSSSTRATTADPEIAKWLHQRRFPPRALAGHRPQPAQRDLLARRRHAGLAGARRECRRARARSGAPSGRRYDPAKANQLLDEIGLTEKDGEGFRLRTDNGERLRLEVQAVRRLRALAADRGDDRRSSGGAIGIQPDVRRLERIARHHPHAQQRASDHVGPTAAPS